jgi:hypothetical protein
MRLHSTSFRRKSLNPIGTVGLKKGDRKKVFVISYIVFPAANPRMRETLVKGNLVAPKPIPSKLG